ncbi:MAG TPA: iron-containing alcohol dehydrogenase [Candidatus Acetothermia bacterium]|nr:iron-containing alcohol dehydrogenase [Candidatus Acetothermia bacterium]
MIRHFESPPLYVQGPNLLARCGAYLGRVGVRLAVIADAVVEGIVRDPLERTAEEHDLDIIFLQFGGECERGEVERLAALCLGVDAVVGAGGGRAVDAAKLVGDRVGIPVVSCPTVASTDAPVSRVAVLNHADGSVEEIRLLSRSPALVLVDSQIVAAAPPRYLVAGMGDAMATWFEARACWRAGGKTLFGHAPTWAGLSLARQCWENLRRHAREALSQAQAGVVGEALETVIETNILLSGLGFENGGLALAHAIHNGLTRIPSTHEALHGEKVAFGLLVQCVAEEAEEVEEVLSLLLGLGLPVTLGELGLERSEEALFRVVEYVFEKETNKLENEPVQLSPEGLMEAMLRADALGRAARSRG